MDPSEKTGSITHFSQEPSYLFSLFPLSLLYVDTLVGVSQVLAMCGLPVPQTNPFSFPCPPAGTPTARATGSSHRCHSALLQEVQAGNPLRCSDVDFDFWWCFANESIISLLNLFMLCKS